MGGLFAGGLFAGGLFAGGLFAGGLFGGELFGGGLLAGGIVVVGGFGGAGWVFTGAALCDGDVGGLGKLSGSAVGWPGADDGPAAEVCSGGLLSSNEVDVAVRNRAVDETARGATQSAEKLHVCRAALSGKRGPISAFGSHPL